MFNPEFKLEVAKLVLERRAALDGRLNMGRMPQHTNVMVTKQIHRSFGGHNPAFGTAADCVWIVRVLSSANTSISYCPDRTLANVNLRRKQLRK